MQLSFIMSTVCDWMILILGGIGENFIGLNKRNNLLWTVVARYGPWEL